jgi:hypothetical protein
MTVQEYLREAWGVTDVGDLTESDIRDIKENAEDTENHLDREILSLLSNGNIKESYRR